MRKSEDYHYEWRIKWNGSCYRGWYHETGWRDIWWIPFLLIAGPIIPAWVVIGIWWIIHLL